MDLKQLNRDIINRQANGKTIWQPRIGCWYDDRIYRKEELPDGYQGFSRKQIYEKIGCSDRLYLFNECIETHMDDTVQFSVIQLNELMWEHKYITPVGEVSCIYKGNTDNPGIMPKKWFIEEEEDLKVYSYIENATSYTFNMETYDKLYQEFSHLGLPTVFLQRTGIQRLSIDLAGVENTIYLLQDNKEVVEDYLKALSESQQKLIKAVADSPIEWINYGDNIHSKLLPPDLFQEYLLPEYEKRGDVLHKAGKFTYSHWDGDVKELLPYAKSCFLDGIEAITPFPQGDVSIDEIKNALGNEVFLIDGTASVLFSNTFPLQLLQKQVAELMERFEGQLILGISDEFPSDGLLDRLVVVKDMVDEFNIKR